MPHKLYKPRGPAIWTKEGGWEPIPPGSQFHPIQQAERNEMPNFSERDQVRVRLSDDQRRRLYRIAKSRQSNTSALIREAVDMLIEYEEQDEKV